ncbi:MAG TPA: two-component regulator propeller domain-containing protein [Kofleriaceae bacterium]|nr:two-component regulator propeller domain-containing protein [Kofleriaceae bacterium]
MVRHLALASLVVLGVVLGAASPTRAAPRGAPPVTRPAAAPAARGAAAPSAATPAATLPDPPAASGASKTVLRIDPPFGCDRLTIAEGLPNAHVRSIVQDQRGFMWFGTADGLARYDGIQMRVYRANESDPKSISSGFVAALALDPSGKIWIGTPEGGINLYDPDTDQFTRFLRGKGGTGTEGAAAIAKDAKDRVWFALSGGGLSRFDPATNSFTDFAAKPLDTTITSLHADAAGNLWLGTASEGVIRWNPDTNAATSFKDELDVNNVAINAIFASPSGKVWIGSDGEGLLALDPATKKITRYEHSAQSPTTISDDHIQVLFEDKNKMLWVGTSNGLNRIDAAGKIVRYMHDPKDPKDPTRIAFPTVEAIYQDAGGVMWIGGFTVGVCKVSELRQRFGHHRTQSQTKSMFEDSDGTAWIGTYNGLYKYEWAAQRVTIYHSLGRNLSDEDPAPLESVWINTLHRDRRGTLWMALLRNGLVAFDPKTETYRRYLPDPEKPNSLPVDTIFDIWEDERGMLWLASWGGGLLRFDPQLETFTAFTTEAGDDANSLSSNHLYRLYLDPTDKKVLWLGTGKGGVIRFNTTAGTAQSFRYRADDPASLSSDDVLSIYRDASGSVWVGTFGGGLNKLDPSTGKAERFNTTNSGLTNNTVHGILPDADGKLWMSTNGGGLVQLDPKTGKFIAYDTSDGIQDAEFSQSSFMLSKSGRLFFGGAGGFNAFQPKEITRDPYVPPVVMTNFKVFNQEVKLGRPIWTLPSLQVSYSDSFELQFAALAFAAPQKNRYAYKLEGFDDDFIEIDRPFATYTKLDGGNYTLRVRAANRHGVWNEAGIALKLKVTPPLWRTWQAYGVYVLLLAGAAYLVIRLQRARVQRAEREGRLAVVERDLELTGAVQTGFLPDHNEITTHHMTLFGYYRPADACSGDWWWYEPLPGGRHLILVGDVTGHGPGPAMVTAAVATAFRVLIEDGLDNVQHGLERLNREVLRVAKGKYHMTMAALELEEATGRWVFYSAGAPPILGLNQQGKHRVHFCPGSPLGTESGFEIGRVEGQLDSSERLLLYTDGIPEIILPNGNVMGMRRFAQQYELTRGQRLRDAAASILLHADQTRGNQPQTDDWTFAIVEWH